MPLRRSIMSTVWPLRSRSSPACADATTTDNDEVHVDSTTRSGAPCKEKMNSAARNRLTLTVDSGKGPPRSLREQATQPVTCPSPTARRGHPAYAQEFDPHPSNFAFDAAAAYPSPPLSLKNRLLGHLSPPRSSRPSARQADRPGGALLDVISSSAYATEQASSR